MARDGGEAQQTINNGSTGPDMAPEDWRIAPFPFKPLKHNSLIAPVARYVFGLRAREVERFIFTATTGRSGTLTLTKLFSAVPGCAAVHEPHPVMNGPVLEAATHGNTALVDRVYRQVKSVNILRAAAGHRYYLEANHQFIKTFWEHAIREFGDRIAVVHLVRPAVEVAESIYCLEDYPGRERGNYWWLDYRAPGNLIRIADILESDPEFSHPFYKALWYWHEIEARVSGLRARMPAIKVTRFETAWLNDGKKVFGLLDELEMRYDTSAIKAILGKREHTKDHQKTAALVPTLQAEQMARRFQDLLATRGLKEPDQAHGS